VGRRAGSLYRCAGALDRRISVTLYELGLVLASALLHAWWSVAIKESRDPLAFNLLQLAAPFGLLLLLGPFVSWAELPPRVWWLLSATGVWHGLYFYWMTRAFEHGDLTLVYPIARSTPAFLPLISVPLLGERISPGAALGIAIVVSGIWLVGAGAGVSRSALASRGARFAFLTLAAGVGYSLTDKAAMTRLGAAPWSSPVPRAFVYAVLTGIVGAAVFAPLAWWRHPRGLPARLKSGGLGRATFASIVSYGGYALVLAAMQTAPVSYVVAARQTSVLFALLLGVLWLRETPGRPRVLGACATVAGVALIAVSG
jgi:drug/metabolite transporter (DMT)-like permease